MTTFIEYKYDNHHHAYLDVLDQGYRPTEKKGYFDKIEGNKYKHAVIYQNGMVLFCEQFVQ